METKTVKFEDFTFEVTKYEHGAKELLIEERIDGNYEFLGEEEVEQLYSLLHWYFSNNP